MGFNFGESRTPGKAGKGKRTFITKANALPDPLAGVDYTGDLETDSAAELDALAQGFRERRDNEAERVKNATDSEYWFAVCFRTREDKEAFLRGIKAGRLGDKYLDGHMLAKLLGVDLPE